MKFYVVLRNAYSNRPGPVTTAVLATGETFPTLEAAVTKATTMARQYQRPYYIATVTLQVALETPEPPVSVTPLV